MCGRFTLTPKKLKEGIGDLPLVIRSDLELAYQPSFNIAPSQNHPLIFSEKKLVLDFGRWGLIPSWSKDPAKSFINARIESAMEKPSFRQAIRRSRCLIPADGFYEWAKEGSSKQPYFFHLKDRKPFFFAGIFNSWVSPDGKEDLRTFSILTAEATPSMKGIHHRMPVILKEYLIEPWLNTSEENLPGLIKNTEKELETLELKTYRVSKEVNSPRNNDETCLTPIADL